MPKNAKKAAPRAMPAAHISPATIASLVGRLRDLQVNADAGDLLAAIGDDAAAVPAAASALGQAGDDPAPAALEALLELPAFALPAVEALGRVRDEVAVRLLEQATATPDKVVAKAARRALHAIASSGLRVTAPRPNPERAVFQALPPDGVAWSGALVSPIDEDGSRSLLVGQKRLPTGAATAIAVLSETLGLAFFQASPQTHRQLDKEWQIFLNDRPNTLAQEVPFGYAQRLLAEAAERTTHIGEPLPEEYTAWLEFAGTPPAGVSSALIYAEVGVDTADPPIVTTVQAESLLEEIELAPWSVPDDAVSAYADELLLAQNSPIVLSEAAIMSRDYQIGARATDEYFSAEVRHRYRRRLEETALLLQRSDRPTQAQVALASAIALGDQSIPSSEIPFAVALTMLTLLAPDVEPGEFQAEPGAGELLLRPDGLPLSG